MLDTGNVGQAESTAICAEGDSADTNLTGKRSAQHLDDDGSNILMSKVPRHTREHYPATHHTCIPESSATVGNMEMQNVQAQFKTNESCIKEGDQGETLSSDSDEDGDGEFI